MPVVYTGILPDLFRENQALIATGHMRGDTFVAEQVLAKHDDTYVPQKVADKMGLAPLKHGLPTPAEAPADVRWWRSCRFFPRWAWSTWSWHNRSRCRSGGRCVGQ